MKLAYIGIDLFFDALLALDGLGCEIAEIFSCETDNITEFNVKICNYAKKNNIPCKMSRITAEDIDRLKKEGCEFGICAGYYYKIPVVADFPIVNIHPSLLPVGRGSWPMPQTILRGFDKSGVTVHKIAEEFDTGDILLQEEFGLEEYETLVSFMDKVYSRLPQMMKALVENFDCLWQNAVPQKSGEYWEAPSRQDMTVRADMTAREADSILRAFLGYECFYDNRFEIIGGRGYRGKSTLKDVLPLKDGYITYDRIRDI